MLIDGVHFRLEETEPRRIGRKAVARCLSDIAAMAGDAVAVVAALAVTEDLTARSEGELPMLIGEYPTARFPAPKFVATDGIVVKIRRASLIACGGVQVNPWAIVANNQSSTRINLPLPGNTTILAYHQIFHTQNLSSAPYSGTFADPGSAQTQPQQAQIVTWNFVYQNVVALLPSP